MKMKYTCWIATLFTSLTLTIYGADDHSDHEGHDHGDHAGHEEHADHEDKGSHEGHDHGEHEDENLVRITPEVMQEFDIPLQSAGSQSLKLEVTLPGTVHVNMDTQAHITPRYAGLVTDVKKSVGDSVKADEVMAVLESNESLTTYELKSLIAGTVIDRHITLGETLSEGDVVFTVANLESVWIDLTVYQSDMASIKKGQKVQISGGTHMPSAEGVISYMSPTVDEHTRTSLARVVIPNPDGTWRPGSFISGRIEVSTHQASIVVPREALVTINGELHVFVETDGGLQPRAVQTGIRDDAFVEIRAGLKYGERYVTKNALPLKAELNRAALEHAGHAH